MLSYLSETLPPSKFLTSLMDGHGPMVIDNILVWLDRSVQYKRDSEQVFRYYHLTPIALITTLIDYFFSWPSAGEANYLDLISPNFLFLSVENYIGCG